MSVESTRAVMMQYWEHDDLSILDEMELEICSEKSRPAVVFILALTIQYVQEFPAERF